MRWDRRWEPGAKEEVEGEREMGDYEVLAGSHEEEGSCASYLHAGDGSSGAMRQKPACDLDQHEPWIVRPA